MNNNKGMPSARRTPQSPAMARAIQASYAEKDRARTRQSIREALTRKQRRQETASNDGAGYRPTGLFGF